MTTTCWSLQELMLAALKSKTDAGKWKTVLADNVFGARDWPTSFEQFPIGLFNAPKERKTSLGRAGAPNFTVVADIALHVQVKAKADAGDAGANAVRAALIALQRQIEVAVINDYDLTRSIQQFAYVNAEIGVDSSGAQHLGELVITFGLEFYQGDEDFAEPDADPLEEIALYADFLDLFDPTGTYPDAPFPDAVKPAPRTSGPDGRVEAAALIDLTT